MIVTPQELADTQIRNPTSGELVVNSLATYHCKLAFLYEYIVEIEYNNLWSHKYVFWHVIYKYSIKFYDLSPFYLNYSSHRIC